MAVKRNKDRSPSDEKKRGDLRASSQPRAGAVSISSVVYQSAGKTVPGHNPIISLLEQVSKFHFSIFKMEVNAF